MSINRLNRGGSLSFSQLATGSPYSAINNLLANVDAVVPTQNISLSASLARLKSFAGDPVENTKVNQGVGVGLVSFDNINDARMSEFYGANYLSASIKSQGNGVWYAEFYPDSTVYNANYLTEETSSRVYRYSVYSKPNPPGSAAFSKQSSYVLANDCEEYLSNLTTNRIYKVVLKDVVSNAFTSSFFTGSCAATSTVGSSVSLQSQVSSTISLAVQNIIPKINTNGTLNTFQKNDLTLLVNELPNFVENPRNYTLNGYTRTFTKAYTPGGTRTFALQGSITRLLPNGNYYAGLVTCTGGPPNAGTYSYGIDEVVTTTNQSVIRVFALANSQIAGSCGAPPARAVSNTAATQDCFCNAQTTCNITSISQVHYTGSFWITNPNNESVTITLNNDWINTDNNRPLFVPNGQLIPTFPSSAFVLTANQTKKIGISFGSVYWGQSVQSSSFSAKGTFTMAFTSPTDTKTGYITANWNKAVCVPSSTGGGDSGGCPAIWHPMETKEHGFIPAGEIKVGMHLRGPDGEWNEVTVAYEAEAPIWRTIINGETYDVDDSHLWYVGNGLWKSVKSLQAGDKLEGELGDVYVVDSNELYMPVGKFMHLNCVNKRFLMRGKIIGHNAVGDTELRQLKD
jgi:hypothetical protein